MQNQPKRKHPLLLCLLITLVVGLVALAPSLIRFHGQFIFYGDFITQYVPFIRETRRMLLSGSFSWSWNSFLGDNFYSAYAYYTSTNPFALIAALFPDDLILYATTFITLLKFLVSSACAYLFLRLFAKKESSAIIGAVIYTFSGFAIIVTNYCFFLDIVAVFPLMLYGIERIVRSDRGIGAGLTLTFAVFVNATINYYLFVSSCLICLLYVIFRLELWRFRDDYRAKLRQCGRIIWYGLVGVMLSAFALLPSFLKMLDTPKASGRIGSDIPLLYSLSNIIERIRIFFMPIESHTYHAFYQSYSRGSTAVFLALFGCVFALGFWVRHRKSWITKLSVAFLVILLIPALACTFNLFTDIRYTRWLYGVVLIMDLATVCALDRFAEDDFRQLLRRLYKICTLIMLALCVPITGIAVLAKLGILTKGFPVLGSLASCFSSYFTGFSGIAAALALTAVNYILLGVVLYGSRKLITPRTIMLCAGLCCACNFAVYYCINYIMPTTDTYSISEYYTKYMKEGTVNETETDFTYRIDYPKGIHNYGLFFKEPSVNYYQSIQNKSAAQFATFAGIIPNTSTIFMDIPDESRAELDTLLSVKYYRDYMQTQRSVVPDGFTLCDDSNGVKSYENTNYLPMGFTYDSYVLKKDASDCENWSTPQIMLSTLVIRQQDESRVSELLDKLDLTTASQSDFDLSATADARRTECADSFVGTSSGFTSTITLSRDNYVFYSVPYDDGWNATVNGQSAEVIKVDNGLIAVRCTAGDNDISFTYHTRGLTAGIAISAAGLVLVVLMLIVRRRRRRKELPAA